MDKQNTVLKSRMFQLSKHVRSFKMEQMVEKL